jgi:DNA-binding GntR family transcriptional regulator
MSAILQPVKNRALSDDVADAVREAIFSGKYLPGAPLREMHLAKELGVSQKTVRDALVKLERYGLVVRVPNTETIVTRHSRQEVRERIALRTVLEEMACLEAVKRMRPEDFEALERKLRRLTAAVAARKHFEAAQADLEFHRAIWQWSGNATLYEMLDQLTTPLLAFVSLLRNGGTVKLKDVRSPHSEIIQALRSKKPALIRRVMQEHTTAAYTEFLYSENESLEALLTRPALQPSKPTTRQSLT